MRMQSTGQGAMQSSQPVHSSATTVCMSLLAPRIASTGQACMQSVQPMQSDSSMTATVCPCFAVPFAELMGFGALRLRQEVVDAVGERPGVGCGSDAAVTQAQIDQHHHDGRGDQG